MLDAFAMSFVEQAPGASEPAAAAGGLAPVEKAESQPERAAGRARRVPCLQICLMCAPPGVGALVLPPDEVSGNCESLQVLELERRFAFGRQELIVSMAPIPAPERCPPSLESAGVTPQETVTRICCTGCCPCQSREVS